MAEFPRRSTAPRVGMNPAGSRLAFPAEFWHISASSGLASAARSPPVASLRACRRTSPSKPPSPSSSFVSSRFADPEFILNEADYAQHRSELGQQFAGNSARRFLFIAGATQADESTSPPALRMARTTASSSTSAASPTRSPSPARRKRPGRARKSRSSSSRASTSSSANPSPAAPATVSSRTARLASTSPARSTTPRRSDSPAGHLRR